MFNAAQVVAIDKNADGSLTLGLSFVGDSGEKPVPASLTIRSTTDPNVVRRFAIEQISVLNSADTFGKAVTKGPIDVSPIVVSDPVPTDAEVAFRTFLQDYGRIAHLLSGPLAQTAAVQALVADIVDRFSKHPEYLARL